MDLLVLGGGVFLGRAVLDAALAGGHRVSVFNRGRARTAWPDGVTVLHGDRKHPSALAALSDRRWDAVIDTCGYLPVDVRASALALRPLARRYLFVSSVSAYASFAHAPVREDDALAALGTQQQDSVTGENYGALKALCEQAVQQVFGADALIVRPGLIVGPDDPTGRFSYWVWRALRGGPMLVPAPPQRALQVIDARDLGRWMVEALERDAAGVFNATGPVGDRATWGALIAAVVAAAAGHAAPAPQPVWVDEAFLQQQGISPWSELPVWVPSSDPELTGFDAVDLTRAQASGLRTRPLADTVGDIAALGGVADDDRRLAGKLSRQREAEVLAAWQAHAAGQSNSRGATA